MLSDRFNLIPINYTVAPISYPSGGFQSNYWWDPNDASKTFDGLRSNILGYQHSANGL
jgi:hypothetical protein